MSVPGHDFAAEDVEYLRHGERSLMLTLYRPRGGGPFPAVIDLHGGAWGKGSRGECRGRDEALARAGFVVAALDFRDGHDGYPTALVDINYAIRWLKARAPQLGIRADRVGISGQSSGGHLAMLAAMRPHEPRYTTIGLPASAPRVDASVRCVAMSWPVINPLSRYRNALRGRAAGEAWVNDIPERQGSFWKSDDNMAEGNPMLILERGEKAVLPPALWINGRPDPVHDYRDPESPIAMNEPERFVANYRKAGGAIELVYVEQAARLTAATFDPVSAFFRRHLCAAAPVAALAK